MFIVNNGNILTDGKVKGDIYRENTVKCNFILNILH